MNSPYVDGVKNVTASKYNYNECLSQILDKHTPAKQIEVTIKGRGVNLNMIGTLLTLRARCSVILLFCHPGLPRQLGPLLRR